MVFAAQWSVIVFSLFLLEIKGAQSFGDALPCQDFAGSCRANVRVVDENLTHLDVICVCQKSEDVSEKLMELSELKCPGIPHRDEDAFLNRTRLTIKLCNVTALPFSLKILKILRRSYDFGLDIDGASYLRLEPADVLISKKDRQISVHGRFHSSHLSGLVRGWITGADNVTLLVQNCSVDVINTQFVEGKSNANVNISIENSRILTIHGFAFVLPRSGALSIVGGQILQLESDAIAGGKEVSIEAAILTNVQKKALNVYGLTLFRLESCIVAKIGPYAVVEDRLHRQLKPTSNHKFYAKTLLIRQNKFIDADWSSFGSLCMVEKLEFQNNYFQNLNGDPTLKSRHCSLQRDWWSSVWNNGFRCSRCQNLFKQPLQEQLCALYETGWCLDEEKEEYIISNSTKEYEEDKVPYRMSVRKYLEVHCTEDKTVSNYEDDCDPFSDKVPQLAGKNAPRITSLSSAGGVASWAIFISIFLFLNSIYSLTFSIFVKF